MHYYPPYFDVNVFVIWYERCYVFREIEIKKWEKENEGDEWKRVCDRDENK